MAAAAKVANTRHGFGNTPTHRVWIDMQRRCYQPHRPDFPRYGGRGITVCEEWRASFETFLRDMGPKPADRTLDRIDNNGPYSPENCRWATRQEQALNRRPR